MREIIIASGHEVVRVMDVPKLIALALHGAPARYPLEEPAPEDGPWKWDPSIWNDLLRLQDEQDHRKALRAAVDSGAVAAVTRARLPAGWGNHALLTVDVLRSYVAGLGLAVKVESAEGSVPVAAAAPPVKTSPSQAPCWKDQAREEARRIRKQREAQGLFPGLVVLGEEVARLFRERGITGPNGHALSGTYIKRHALQGHDITADRLKATLNQRGK